ncbi:hypothetical protein M6B38_285270 [Iris pallida]|uniref:Uncharacterized protein n=1 Tax=Iris pallida TaxID=29817 RepID=A0AAX6I313_IRIPA|nr:hypothetical protein M6B38_221225 [Iris pallida]KAJ6847187.1 hypothetical protein M6B38_285270 [Iris pallida]
MSANDDEKVLQCDLYRATFNRLVKTHDILTPYFLSESLFSKSMPLYNI